MSNVLKAECWNSIESPRSAAPLRYVLAFGKLANQPYSRFGKRGYHGFGEYLSTAEGVLEIVIEMKELVTAEQQP